MATKKTPGKRNVPQPQMIDRPEQAVESGEPGETGRTRGRVRPSGKRQDPASRRTKHPPSAEQPESGRPEADVP